jgi:hypothetical protein
VGVKWRDGRAKEDVRDVRGFIVVWKRPCRLRLAALFVCRYVEGPASGEEDPVPAPDDDRREWSWCEGSRSRSRSGLGARDGAKLARRLMDRLDGVDPGELAVSRCVSMGGGACSESERSSSELTYSRSEASWPVGGGDTYCGSRGVCVPEVKLLCRPSWSESSCTGLMPRDIHRFVTRRTA